MVSPKDVEFPAVLLIWRAFPHRLVPRNDGPAFIVLCGDASHIRRFNGKTESISEWVRELEEFK